MENIQTSIRDTMFAQFEDKKLFEQARDYAFAYIDNLNQQPVFPSTCPFNSSTGLKIPLLETALL